MELADGPAYFVPETLFQIKGPGSTAGNWLYDCKKCLNKTISVNVKSRANLKNHVKSKHSSSLKEFEELCAAYDNRKAQGKGELS